MKTFKYVWFLLLLTLSGIGFSQEQPTMLSLQKMPPSTILHLLEPMGKWLLLITEPNGLGLQTHPYCNHFLIKEISRTEQLGE
jgi:hypothetical protein